MAPRPSTTPRCTQCRRKKIKCDYIPPQCGPCVRSNLQCTPFKTQLVFVEQLPKRAKASQSQQLALLPSGLPPIIHSHNRGNLQTLPPIQTLLRSPFLNGKFTRSNSFGEFVMQYVPNEFRKPGETCITWITTVQKNQETTPSTDAGAHALGLVVKGKETRDPRLIAQSMKMYGIAVSRLRNELLNPQPNMWYRSLVSTMVLLQYENQSASMQLLQGYTSYSSGIASVLKMIKPSELQRGERHSVFLHCRAVLIMTGVMYGVKSFITDEKWSTVPFKHNPKAPFHTCLDIFSEIPHTWDLARDVDGAAEASPFPSEAWNAFHQEWRIMDQRFAQWLENILQTRGPLFHAQAEARSNSSSPSSRSSTSDQPDETEVYIFRVVEDSAAMFTYWSGRLMLLQVMRHVAQSLQKDLSATANRIIRQNYTTWMEAAEGILRAIPFSLRASSGIVGMQSMALPLKIASDFYEFFGMPDRSQRCKQFGAQLAAKEFSLGRCDIQT